MKKKIKEHASYYLSLLLILAVGMLLASHTAYDTRLQFAVVALTTFCYLAWGILHHLLRHDLSAKVVVEYVLMGSLGMAVALFLLRAS